MGGNRSIAPTLDPPLGISEVLGRANFNGYFVKRQSEARLVGGVTEVSLRELTDSHGLTSRADDPQKHPGPAVAGPHAVPTAGAAACDPSTGRSARNSALGSVGEGVAGRPSIACVAAERQNAGAPAPANADHNGCLTLAGLLVLNGRLTMLLNRIVTGNVNSDRSVMIILHLLTEGTGAFLKSSLTTWGTTAQQLDRNICCQ